MPWLGALVGGSVLALAAAAGRASEPRFDYGRELARTICSSCHQVGAGEQSPPRLDPPATSFAEIANRPGASSARLREFVISTHWDGKTLPLTMPKLSLTPEQASALADYIMSLKRP